MKYLTLGAALLFPLALLSTGCTSDNLSVDYGASGAAELQKSDTAQSRSLLNSAMPCCPNLSQLSYETIKEPGQFDNFITGDSQVFSFATGKSYLIGKQLPNAEGDITITLSCAIMASAFIPTVLILDQDFKPIRLIGEEQIKYTKATLLNSDRYLGQFKIQEHENAKYFIVYTTDKALAEETQLESLSADALASGSVKIAERVYLNKPIPHSPIGAVRLAINYKPNTLILSNDLNAEIVNSERFSISSNSIPKSTPSFELVQSKSVPAELEMIELETEAMFTQLIQKAVKSGDLNKAMEIVKEAEKSGFLQARQALIDAL